MSRRRKSKKAKPKGIPQPVQQAHRQNWWKKNVWNLVGLILTVVTGLALPVYFQFEAGQSQQSNRQAIYDVQQLQMTTVNEMASLHPSCITITNVESLLRSFPFTQKNVTTNRSYIRIANVSSCVGTADLFDNAKSVINTFAFGEITDYVTVESNHDLQVALVGKGIGAQIIERRLKLEPGKAYTIIASGNHPESLSLVPFLDMVT